MSLPAQTPQGDTSQIAGSALNPASGATLCQLAAAVLPAGRYLVRARAWQSGTPDTAIGNQHNVQVKKGAGTTIANIPSNDAATGFTELYVTLDGTTALLMNIGATATGAAAVYSATISAERLY